MLHTNYMCICVMNYMCVHVYAYKLWDVVCAYECGVCVKEREREAETAMETEERAHPPSAVWVLPAALSPAVAVSPAQSLPPAGDIALCHLALQCSCAVRNQEGELFGKEGRFWKSTKVKKKKQRRLGRKHRLPEKRQRPRTHVGDPIGKLRQAQASWLTLGGSKAFLSLE